MSKKRTVLIILVAASLVVIFFIIRYFLQTPCIIKDDDEAYTPEPLTKYGIPVDSLVLYEGVVLPRETLSDILNFKQPKFTIKF